MTGNIEVTSKHILPSTSYFEIIRHENGERYVYKLLEKMTPAMTQDKLAEFYEKEKQAGNPLPLNSRQTFRLLDDAVISRDSDLINHLQKSLQSVVNTTSIVSYLPLKENPKDKVIHNYHTSDEYTFNKNVVGSDGWFSKISDKHVLKPLLGTSSVKNINNVCHDINGKDGFIFRLNQKPEQKKERAVRFFADSVMLNLHCDGDPLYEHPAFRVLRVE